MSMSDECGAWTTQDEVAFLQRLGQFTPAGEMMGRKTLLFGYLEGASRRTDWADIHKKTVLRIARSEWRAAV